VKVFLCPSRRTADPNSAIPGKEDYAFATDDTWWFGSPPGTRDGTPHWLVVLFGAAGGNVLPTNSPATLGGGLESGRHLQHPAARRQSHEAEPLRVVYGTPGPGGIRQPELGVAGRSPGEWPGELELSTCTDAIRHASGYR
jgi:hypothetical protein